MESIDDLAGVRGTSADDPSGARTAQAAHDAGVVLPIVTQPMWDCALTFRLHGSEGEAQQLVDALALTLLDHPLVLQPALATIAPRSEVND